MNNNKGSYVLRMIAGGYLIYLAYNILTAAMRGETEGHTVPVTIAAVVFIVMGAIILVFGVRGMMQISKEENEMTEEPEKSEEEEETVEAIETDETPDTAETVETIEKETADE